MFCSLVVTVGNVVVDTVFVKDVVVNTNVVDWVVVVDTWGAISIEDCTEFGKGTDNIAVNDFVFAKVVDWVIDGVGLVVVVHTWDVFKAAGCK